MTPEKKSNICPVCGYPDLKDPAYRGDFQTGEPSYEICPSCYFHFGYDDKASHITFGQWREKWLASGAPWNSKGRPKPDNWNPREQLLNIGIVLPDK